MSHCLADALTEWQCVKLKQAAKLGGMNLVGACVSGCWVDGFPL
jgi:hypothetical protein